MILEPYKSKYVSLISAFFANSLQKWNLVSGNFEPVSRHLGYILLYTVNLVFWAQKPHQILIIKGLILLPFTDFLLTEWDVCIVKHSLNVCVCVCSVVFVNFISSATEALFNDIIQEPSIKIFSFLTSLKESGLFYLLHHDLGTFDIMVYEITLSMGVIVLRFCDTNIPVKAASFVITELMDIHNEKKKQYIPV